ncbi:hypothetical protein F2P81_003659 [Scophthalmus maximus]|uniref:Phosphatase 1 regulatory subunit 14B n=1 Tax=Scophthalmus maximus TaxID=52904 RepID=A0A6A4TP01_SCOMX|nr:hypothetical protein F2P81_003659 [Scophthalmus maximus]
MASEPSTQSRVMFQATDKAEEPAHRKLGKLTVKYNRKDLQRRLDIEEWIDGQLHLLFDCEEEEIPELEIDIDELLELPDEGQRSRLQCRNVCSEKAMSQCCVSAHLFSSLGAVARMRKAKRDVNCLDAPYVRFTCRWDSLRQSASV